LGFTLFRNRVTYRPYTRQESVLCKYGAGQEGLAMDEFL